METSQTLVLQALLLNQTANMFEAWRGYYEYDMGQAHTLETALNVFAKFSPKIPDSLRKQPFVMLGNIDPNRRYLHWLLPR